MSDEERGYQVKAFVLRTIQRRHEMPHTDYEFLSDVMGLKDRTLRLIRAFVHLERHGFAPEGDLLLRSALEHAVTLQWIYTVVGGAERFSVSAARAELTFLESEADLFERLNFDVPHEEKRLRSELLSTVRGDVDAVSTSPGLPNFQRGMLEPLDPDGYLRHIYRTLSQRNHVTHAALVKSF